MKTKNLSKSQRVVGDAQEFTLKKLALPQILPNFISQIDSSYTSLLWSLFGVIPIKEISSRRDQAFKNGWDMLCLEPI
ncbi:hypothetical protein CEXT_256911 [Caerostris extrusa]|uniref:Uncharacterized protein n=1 Tax=Caerostris extrusa TaxID=172846 RepID=A0AAV4XAS0_CAEEX|nr:hypothetical protein CEXT_256911 [Caerostris extrusa]